MGSIDSDLKKLGLGRHDPVGKKMGSKVWGHIHYICDVIPAHYTKAVLMIAIEKGFDPQIVRYDSDKDEVCLIECHDFDTADEPAVGRSLLIPMTSGDVKITNPSSNPLIYHHKWMFVKDDYQGFDVKKSKQRSIWWKSRMGKDRRLSSRIGRLSFWQSWIESLEHKNGN